MSTVLELRTNQGRCQIEIGIPYDRFQMRGDTVATRLKNKRAAPKGCFAKTL